MYSTRPAPTLELLSRLCQDGEWQRGPRSTLPSGFAQLDASLPGGGWPMGALCELLPAALGIGELSLLAPALSQLAGAGRQLVFIEPPYLPYAPALAQQGLPLERLLIVKTCGIEETLWAAEQALRCPAVGAVLSWPAHITDRNVRRLQLAAEAGSSLGILYRPTAAEREHSPAALRLRLRPAPGASALAVDIRKCRGGRAGIHLQLSLPRRAAATMSHLHDALAVHSIAAAGT